MIAKQILNWAEAVKQVQERVTQLRTPFGEGDAGTGFLLAASKSRNLVCVGTAAHMVDYADEYDFPIILKKDDTEIKLSAADRLILRAEDSDAAVVIFERPEGSEFMDRLSQTALHVIKQENYFAAGTEVGWVGYPEVGDGELSFFAGYISRYSKQRKEYLVDGVIPGGCSGGPVFCIDGGQVKIMAVAAAYIPDEDCPGLGGISKIFLPPDWVKQFESRHP